MFERNAVKSFVYSKRKLIAHEKRHKNYSSEIWKKNVGGCYSFFLGELTKTGNKCVLRGPIDVGAPFKRGGNMVNAENCWMLISSSFRKDK